MSFFIKNVSYKIKIIIHNKIIYVLKRHHTGLLQYKFDVDIGTTNIRLFLILNAETWVCLYTNLR